MYTSFESFFICWSQVGLPQIKVTIINATTFSTWLFRYDSSYNRHTTTLKEYLTGTEMSKKNWLSLRRNKKKTAKASRYDWSSLNNRDISYQCTVTVRNKFETLQEISEKHTSNDKDGNLFVITHVGLFGGV